MTRSRQTTAPATSAPVRRAAAVAALALALVLAQASAEPQPASGALVLDLDAYVVTQVRVDDALEEVLEPALEVPPGQLLEWWLRATNDADHDLANVALELPIPSTTSYVPTSTALWRLDDMGGLTSLESVRFTLLASADDAASFEAEPLTRTLVDDAGTPIDVPVPLEDYTHVRVVIESFPARTTLVLIVRTVVR